MRCNNCGNEILDDSAFCAYCGVRIESAETDVTEETPVKAENVTVSSETDAEDTIEEGQSTDEWAVKEVTDSDEQPVIKPEAMAVPVKNRNGGVIALIAVLIAAIVAAAAIWGLTGASDIEGEWMVSDNSVSGMFGLFNESYFDFNDDGTAVYYNGVFSTYNYKYSYNRFTRTLRLTGVTGSNEQVFGIDWVSGDEFEIRELGMTFKRIDDIPYDYEDDEYDGDDAVSF